jgi:hypothetical protein
MMSLKMSGRAAGDGSYTGSKHTGYTPSAEPLGADEMIGHRVLFHRMLAASAYDAHRNLWTNSPWELMNSMAIGFVLAIRVNCHSLH